LPKSSSFETRRKRDAPQDEDLELGVHPRDEVPGGGREAAVSKDEVKLTLYLPEGSGTA